MKRLIVLFLAMGSVSALFAQHEYMPLSYDYDMLYIGNLYKKDVDIHSTVKPLRTAEVNQVKDVDSSLKSLQYKGKFFQTWLGRALFSHHFVEVRTADFDLSIDPLLDFRFGKEQGSTNSYTYHNTRGFYVQGRIGKQVTFMTSFSENQARYPDYVNTFVNQTGVVPGQGKARSFKESGFDFQNAFGVLSYTPSKYFNFSLGQGRVFYGEGHRSMFLGDGTFNYPYIQIQTTVWKIKYVNLWTQMRDIRNSVKVNDQYRKKWMSSHYLSYNVNSRLNLNLFEAVVYRSDTNNRGLDASYFNPIILFRPIEFSNGSDVANVIIGFGASYKLTDGLMAYGQFALDEFVKAEIFTQPGSWRNKYSWQLGLKYMNAFRVQGLNFRGELNSVRPYMYQHSAVTSNYGHYNQPLAHTWGGNLFEMIFQANYRFKRVVVDLQINLGRTGFDDANSNWGKNIYLSYSTREQDDNNAVAQGLTANIFYAEGRLAYIVNPSYNMRLEGGLSFRGKQFVNEGDGTNYNRPYLYVGLRTGLFNNYFDF